MKFKILMTLTLMAAGRAMTIPFIAGAGDGGPGDAPASWLMPLIGDALVGVTALLVAWLLWKRPGLGSWVFAIAWSAVAAFDALAAFVVDTTDPWPEFFMLELFGRSMFFAAVLLHIAIIWLLSSDEIRNHFGISTAT